MFSYLYNKKIDFLKILRKYIIKLVGNCKIVYSDKIIYIYYLYYNMFYHILTLLNYTL